MTDFQKFAMSNGISSNTLGSYGRYINPVIPEEHKLNVATMDVFSRLLMDRIIFLGVPIDDDVANIIQAQLLYLDGQDKHKDITMYINSPGGQVSSGLGILDTMNYVDAHVNTICTGMAASMASILLSAGDKRYILPHGKVMIHQPLGGVQGQASDILIEAEEIEKTKNELCSILAENCKQPLKKVIKDCDRNYWMNSEEAVAYGIVDNILINFKKK